MNNLYLRDGLPRSINEFCVLTVLVFSYGEKPDRSSDVDLVMNSNEYLGEIVHALKPCTVVELKCVNGSL